LEKLPPILLEENSGWLVGYDSFNCPISRSEAHETEETTLTGTFKVNAKIGNDGVSAYVRCIPVSNLALAITRKVCAQGIV